MYRWLSVLLDAIVGSPLRVYGVHEGLKIVLLILSDIMAAFIAASLLKVQGFQANRKSLGLSKKESLWFLTVSNLDVYGHT
jgi:hypothetical protein